MSRLDTERQNRLEPKRMAKAIEEIEKRGYTVIQLNETSLKFKVDDIGDSYVTYFPYSGWHTGRSIKDGRGLSKLLRQL